MGNFVSCLSSEKNEEVFQQPHSSEPSANLQLIDKPLTDRETLTDGVTLEYTDQPKAQAKDLQISTKDNKMPVMRYLPRIPSLPRDKKQPKELCDSKISSMFEAYKDPETECISSDGICRMCKDLNVDPDDFQVLVFAWKCDASIMGQLTEDEFKKGCYSLECDSIKCIQSKLPTLVDELSEPSEFKKLYKFVYPFALGSEPKLNCDVAIMLWSLVFSRNIPGILPKWIDFLQSHSSIRFISEDTWSMFLKFVECVSEDLSLYDENEAWPSLFDDFVEFQNDQTNQNISKEFKIQE